MGRREVGGLVEGAVEGGWWEGGWLDEWRGTCGGWPSRGARTGRRVSGAGGRVRYGARQTVRCAAKRSVRCGPPCAIAFVTEWGLWVAHGYLRSLAESSLLSPQ